MVTLIHIQNLFSSVHLHYMEDNNMSHSIHQLSLIHVISGLGQSYWNGATLFIMFRIDLYMKCVL